MRQCLEDITSLLLAGGMHVEIMKIIGVRGVARHCGAPVPDTKLESNLKFLRGQPLVADRRYLYLQIKIIDYL